MRTHVTPQPRRTNTWHHKEREIGHGKKNLKGFIGRAQAAKLNGKMVAPYLNASHGLHKLANEVTVALVDQTATLASRWTAALAHIDIQPPRWL